MRISTRMLQQNALRGLRANLNVLSRAQDQAVDGRRIHTVSDDPVDAAQVMRLDAEVNDLDRYRRNGAAGTLRMSSEDQVLTAVRELLTQAHNLALSVASLPPADPQRQTALNQVELIRQELVSLGNTRAGDQYIFGGGRSTSPPFQTDGTYVGDSKPHVIELTAGTLLETNHTGDQIFTSALGAVAQLAQELQTGTTASIQAMIPVLDAARENALSLQTELGVRLAEVESTGQSLAKRAATLLDQRDRIRNVDPSEAAVNLTAAQSALERAYAAVAKVLSTNLLDYLR
jgi:flagellar hook-associated protein 3 FlgL